ncbi:T9SS type A sorting domain-containing protein [Epilithonimonas sp. UC225_85]|uniref:T9SS type A sorting domain-containing protein n=1 Tax=Epilithonimonas sp. UC225_85 TaxID=3350167 RepID=UPI0036D3D7BA
MKHFSFLFLFINALIFAQANVAYDASFGSNGRLFTTNPAQYTYNVGFGTVQYKTIQNIDNKLISVSGNASISRYNLNGTLDTAFANSGTRVVMTVSNFNISDLANLSDGSILVLVNNSTKSYIYKYSANGTPDTTFGNGGVLELFVTTYQNRFDYIKVLPNDSILIEGSARVNTTSQGIMGVIKIDKNGNYDTSFSLDGKVTLSSTTNSYTISLGIDTDSANNIYVGFESTPNGTFNYYGNVQKLSPNGTTVTSFGNNGIASQYVSVDSTDMRVFPNGKVLIAATSNTNGSNDAYLVAFSPAGTLEGTFRYDIDNGSNDNIEKIVIVDNNTFFLTGYTVTGGIGYGLVLKFNSNFALDTTFNNSGIFTTYYFSNKNSSNYDLILQKDRKLLLTGAGVGAGNTTNSNIGMIRLIDTKLLATNEIKKINNISIYPNPASNVINLQTDKSLVGKAYDIVDMTGKSVIKNKLSDKEINVSNLTTGNYILKIDNESYKFIKK